MKTQAALSETIEDVCKVHLKNKKTIVINQTVRRHNVIKKKKFCDMLPITGYDVLTDVKLHVLMKMKFKCLSWKTD